MALGCELALSLPLARFEIDMSMGVVVTWGEVMGMVMGVKWFPCYRARLVMLKSQAFFKLATKKNKIFWLFCFSGFTLAKNKQKGKSKKTKKN